MSKTKKTLDIEDILYHMCQKKGLYGCDEVTIGFANKGLGNEIVDFMTMDSKGILKCYEIKVSLSDLKSNAKKSWYGHYNYLFVTKELYGKILSKLNEYIPEHVGVAIPCNSSWSCGLQIKRAAAKQRIGIEQELTLKESMVRSMSYRINKYRDASDMQKYTEMKSSLKAKDKECELYRTKLNMLMWHIDTIESILRNYYDKDISLEKIGERILNGKYIFPETIHLELNTQGKENNHTSAEREE